VDLLLMHFPGSIDAVQSPARNRQLRELTWRAMESAQAAGKARAIGVANFTRRHLKELLPSCKTRPAVNQIEVHPWRQLPEVVEYHRRHGIATMCVCHDGADLGDGDCHGGLRADCRCSRTGLRIEVHAVPAKRECLSFVSWS